MGGGGWGMVWRIFLVALLYFGLLLDMHFANGGWKQNFELGNISVMVMSYVFLTLMFLFVDITVPRRFARWINTLLAMVYTLLAYYHTNTGASLDFAVLANNWQAAVNSDGPSQVMHLLYDNFVAANVFWSLVAGALVYSSYRIRRQGDASPRLRRSLQGAFIFLGIFLVTQVGYSHDQFSRLGRSFFRWYFPERTVLHELSEKQELLPGIFVQSAFPAERGPNIFLVLVESFNSRFVGQKHHDGREYTPYLNSLISRGVWIDNYYSPSVQTGKGHFAALCGQAPSLQSIEFRTADCAPLKCVPSFFEEAGYRTVFLQAHADMSFDNERVFLKSHGVQEYPELTKVCAKEKDPCYGWGLRDDVFFQRSLSYLESKQVDSRPLFAVMATISSHQPFTAVPKNQRFFYSEPQSRREAYLNHLPWVDRGLQVLIEGLQKSSLGKNAIVVITGDHGFPLGEHGNSHNENFAFEENFKVPLLILDLSKENRLRKSGPFSHLNLPATLLDLAGWSGQTPFVEGSIFTGDRATFVPLVQPYSGGYLGAIQWPWKYVVDRSRFRESVYDLEQDPAESIDRVLTAPQKILEGLRSQAAQILRQQEVLRCSQ